MGNLLSEMILWSKAGNWAVWGVLGALIGETIRYFYNRETLPSKHWVYVLFAGICGALLCILMEPGTKLGAFTLGIGWLATLAKMVRAESLTQIVEDIDDVVKKDETLKEVERVLSKTKADLVPVIDNEKKLVGVITDGMYNRAIKAGKDPEKIKASELMRKQQVKVLPNDSLKKADRAAMRQGVKTLVIEDSSGAPKCFLRKDNLKQALSRTLL